VQPLQVLHDTIKGTETTCEELREQFGATFATLPKSSP
jgi:(p)ppGpp synthase/HD superfamily hydrolase